jgi:hypothetical protein
VHARLFFFYFPHLSLDSLDGMRYHDAIPQWERLMRPIPRATVGGIGVMMEIRHMVSRGNLTRAIAINRREGSACPSFFFMRRAPTMLLQSASFRAML